MDHLICSNNNIIVNINTVSDLLLTNDFLKAMDNKKKISLDFHKAFNKVTHRQKLKYYRITGNLIKWIEQWLNKRNKQVTIGVI